MNERSITAGLLLVSLLVPGSATHAQLVLDGSLGTSGNVPLTAGEYAVTDDLGRYAGADNLFHSFDSFDVGTGETAHFSASLGSPQRVIARVTGGSRSQINGTLRSSIAGADLFLLNASGVALADGAELDLEGSFYTSSADLLRFTSGPDLDVADASPNPLLSTAAPAAFGFTSASPALIEVARTSALSVPAGETLSITGGDVFVTGRPGFGVPDVLSAPGASLEIAAAAGPVDLPVALAGFDVASVDAALLGRVEISTFAKVRMDGVGAIPSGGVVIRGGVFALSSDAQILAKNNSDTAAAQGPIDIAVSGDLILDGGSTRIQSWTAGDRAAGDVRLSGDRVLLSNGAALVLFNGESAASIGSGADAQVSGRIVGLDTNSEILVRSLSSGEGSSVALVASEEARIEGGAAVISDVLGGSLGNGGVLSVAAPQVAVSSGGQVSTLNSGSGTGASIEVTAGALAVSDGGGLVSRASGSGSGGLIDLDLGSLEVSDAGRITSDTTGGPGGDLRVLADGMLVSNATDRPEGTFVEAKNGGTIQLDVGRLELRDGGQVFTRTEGSVTAGELRVVNAGLVVASGVDADGRPSGLFSRSSPAASADGGTLSIQTRVLELNDGAEFSSATFGAGAAGSIAIDSSERVSIRGGSNGISLVSASSAPGATGDGGTIRIGTDLLELRDGGRVTTSTTGVGDAGRIDATARIISISGVDPATAANASGFFSRSNTPTDPNGGNGGDVFLTASETIRMSDRAEISTSSSGGGLAGDIVADGGSWLRMRDSTITTQALSSSGGNVKVAAADVVFLADSTIETDVLGGAGGGGDVAIDPVHTVLQRSSVTARAVAGDGGNISIVTDYYFPSGESFLDASSQLGIDGSIDVTPPDSDLVASLAELRADYLDASSQLERDCDARTARAGSFRVQTKSIVRPQSDPSGMTETMECSQEEAAP